MVEIPETAYLSVNSRICPCVMVWNVLIIRNIFKLWISRARSTCSWMAFHTFNSLCREVEGGLERVSYDKTIAVRIILFDVLSIWSHPFAYYLSCFWIFSFNQRASACCMFVIISPMTSIMLARLMTYESWGVTVVIFCRCWWSYSSLNYLSLFLVNMVRGHIFISPYYIPMVWTKHNISRQHIIWLPSSSGVISTY